MLADNVNPDTVRTRTFIEKADLKEALDFVGGRTRARTWDPMTKSETAH